MFRVRVRYPTGTSTLEVSSAATFEELEQQISAASAIPVARLEIRAGFPPCLLSLAADASLEGHVAANETLTAAVHSGGGDARGASAGGAWATGGKRASSSSGGKRRRPHGLKGAIQLKSKEDVETSLVSALSGGTKGRKGKFLRRATRGAVSRQYDIVSGNARLHAALKGDVEITDADAEHRLEDGRATTMLVRWKKTRSWVEETVDAIPVVALSVVLQMLEQEEGGAGREHLKPHNLAETSPRVFWSLYRHCGSDIAAGIKMLMPGVDLSHLDRRTTRLSEKAQENQRQLLEDSPGWEETPPVPESDEEEEGIPAAGRGTQPTPRAPHVRGTVAARLGCGRGMDIVERVLAAGIVAAEDKGDANAAGGLDEAAPIPWQSDGHPYIGMRALRQHGAWQAVGTITRYAPPGNNAVEDPPLWHIAHDDGDAEDLDEQQVEAAVQAFHEHTVRSGGGGGSSSRGGGGGGEGGGDHVSRITGLETARFLEVSAIAGEAADGDNGARFRRRHLAASEATVLRARMCGKQESKEGMAAPPSLLVVPTEDQVATWIQAARYEEMQDAMESIIPQQSIRESLGRLGVTLPRDVTKFRAGPIHRFLLEDPLGVVASPTTPATPLPSEESIQLWRTACWSRIADQPWMADYTNGLLS